MTVHINGSKAKELYYDGSKIKEAWYNGEKVYSGNVLFEADVTFSTNYTLPTTYPAGSVIEWTASSVAQYDYFVIYHGGTGKNQSVSLGVATITNIAFNELWNINVYETPATRTYHIKITKGA